MSFVVTISSLDDLQRQARPYPAHLLPEMGTALGLFAAGFHGWNDCIWFARAGLQTTCVDVDDDKLLEMAAIYPEGWEFRVDDSWEFATTAFAIGRKWDVVSIDPYKGIMDDALQDLELWCSLANKLVTIGCFLNEPLPQIPHGWKTHTFPRSDTVGWLVLQR